MTELSDVFALLNFFGLGGVGIFLYYLLRGLKQRIATLTELTQEQARTLEAVRSRADEMDRLSESYKRALFDLEEMRSKLDERRNELIQELEAANQRKDDQLAKFTNLQLEEIELKRQSLERLPQLERNLADAVHELESQLKILAPAPKVEPVWAEIARVAAYFEVLYPYHTQMVIGKDTQGESGRRPVLRGFKPRSELGSKKEAGEAEETEK